MKLNISNGDVTIDSIGEYEIIGSSKVHNIHVNSKATIILDNVDIDVSKESKAAIDVDKSGNVIISLRGENKLKSGDNYAGIQMNGKCKVLIKGEENLSSLNIESGTSAAGIGGGYGDDLDGELIIEGGIINILSTREGAGIGGGNGTIRGGNLSGNVTINDGNLNITSGNYGGSGIGGGCSGDLSGEVIINGGKITSVAGKYGIGAGIGGGYDANLSGKLIINKGEVLAIGGEGASGIGGAINITKGGNLSGEVIINGGSITAKGGLYLEKYGGAGIGGGYNGNFSGKLILNDGEITADKAGNANDIGGGSNGEITGKVIIKIDKIQVNPTSLDLYIGESKIITSIVTINPEVHANISNFEKVKYLSEDTTVATVNKNGLVSAVGKGKTKIIVISMLDETKSAICSINVSNEIIKIGEIDLLIQVNKEELNIDELENIICYGNNPIIKDLYIDENIENFNVDVILPDCKEKVNSIVEYKKISLYLCITYSIALYTTKACMENLKIYALQKSEISSHLEFCLSKDEDFDINKFKIILNPKYEIDKNYSNKYYLFKISGTIGLVKN
ncbi:hypothetical protein CHF27_008720 [Romboutsia maritimum]|uniref:BIG2 domain-containing protein n=1 Tax=Romboutsia maritimum TaxID=2020948 RepID=A0A371IS54_9FIRM|nr:Ig-like domain-containing protein [Romboutsia maritimum]RDY23320.1 hypothetical protein CHF27_008720 [Romboutsia maritimum]